MRCSPRAERARRARDRIRADTVECCSWRGRTSHSTALADRVQLVEAAVSDRATRATLHQHDDNAMPYVNSSRLGR